MWVKMGNIIQEEGLGLLMNRQRQEVRNTIMFAKGNP